MKRIVYLALAALCWGLLPGHAKADGGVCPRANAGSEVQRPPDLHSSNGVLNVSLNYFTSMDNAGRTLFCFVTADGLESPTLHVNPGDTINIALTNRLPPITTVPGEFISNDKNKCGDKYMNLSSTNMHFHGTNTSPKCHSDESIRTLVNSGQTFNYKLKIPRDEPPGLYWYHPHVHGISSAAVSGGATGVIVVEGIEKVQPAVAGLPERILVIRDQPLGIHYAHIDPMPNWDVSLNYVPISYPAYQPAIIKMHAGEKEFWRVANTSANTIIDLRLVYDGKNQPLQIVAIDGVPTGSQNGKREGTIITKKGFLLPPASRVEFIATGPSREVKSAMLITKGIDGGPAADSNPERPLAAIRITDEPGVLPRVPERNGPPNPQRFEGLETAKVTAERTLYFSEVPSTGKQGRLPPVEPVKFFITVQGQTPKLYDPNYPPAIITKRGAVEDWIIQNRAPEVHEFHIHQVHFLLLEVNGVPVSKKQRQFYDTIQVDPWDGVSQEYPSVKVRMDFRGPTVGDFLYHCHILEHEDGGMMAKIRVKPN